MISEGFFHCNQMSAKIKWNLALVVLIEQFYVTRQGRYCVLLLPSRIKCVHDKGSFFSSRGSWSCFSFSLSFWCHSYNIIASQGKERENHRLERHTCPKFLSALKSGRKRAARYSSEMGTLSVTNHLISRRLFFCSLDRAKEAKKFCFFAKRTKVVSETWRQNLTNSFPREKSVVFSFTSGWIEFSYRGHFFLPSEKGLFFSISQIRPLVLKALLFVSLDRETKCEKAKRVKKTSREIKKKDRIYQSAPRTTIVCCTFS